MPELLHNSLLPVQIAVRVPIRLSAGVHTGDSPVLPARVSLALRPDWHPVQLCVSVMSGYRNSEHRATLGHRAVRLVPLFVGSGSTYCRE